ncbi:MAG: sulfurtransferase TusA family protein [Gammaproteobacteria bacterium]|nr:sulfurtransferase TusA family protein [Gammaproteobacteria bacterium]
MDTVDASGLLCPFPVIRIQNYVRGVESGTLIRLLATDPGVLEDIPAWCRIHGHQIQSQAKQDSTFEFHILVGSN